MSSVDDRIVNMQFNNKQFEQGANQSKKTLAGLESAVTKTGKSKGLAGMAAGADGVKSKFGLMKIAGISAVATIASKATVAGLGLVKSLTIDPILQGWDEYNTNLKSIQTVMANTGKGIKPVQAALNELNKYSDQTIYNFSEMARNVGTFSAAGVGLKTSVSAIKGIANMAALSGSSSQQASSAMYQLSQAIASGRVNLQDWNSVVNAGMGGKNLQTALINTGIAMGKIDAKTVTWGKNIKIAGQSFRQSISASNGKEAWLGSDVLVKTLALMDGRLSSTALKAKLLAKNQKLSSDQQLSSTEINKRAAEQLEKNQKAMEKQGFTPKQIESMTSMANRAYESATVVKTLPQLLGVVKESIGSVWANAFTGIVGNFEQSKALWTGAANAISHSVQSFSMSLNQGIFMWRKGIDGIGGREAVIRGFKALFGGLADIFKTVGSAFRDVFPPGGESVMAKISIGFMRLMEAIRPSESTLKSLRDIFGGIFAVFHIGLSLVTGIAAGFKALFGALFEGSGKAGGGILKVFASIGDLLKGFDKMLTEGGKMSDFFTTIGTTIGSALHPIVAIISGIIAAIGSIASGGGGATAFFKSIGDSLGGLTGKGDKIASMFNAIGDSLGKLDAGKVKAFFDSLDFSKAGEMARQGIAVASGIISGLVQGLASEGIPAIKAAMSALAGAVIDTIKGVLGIHSPASTMIPIGKNIVLGIAEGISAGIRALPAAMANVGSAIKDTFKQLFGDMDAIDFAGFINAIVGGALMLSLTHFTTNLGGIFNNIKNSFGQLTATLKTMQQEVKAAMILQIAIAVGILAAALVLLAFVPMDKLAKGLGALAIMMGLLVTAMKVMMSMGKTVDENGKLMYKLNANLVAAGFAMMMFATSMLILAAAVAAFGNMDMGTLAKGFGAVALAMALMVGPLETLGAVGPAVAAGGAAMVMAATAMTILSAAVALFGNMDLSTLAVGLGAVAIGMGLMISPLMLLGVVGPGVIAGGAAMILAATAMTVLSAAVALFGNMDIGTLAKGLGAVAIAIALMTGPLGVLGIIGPGVLAGGAAMIMLATAMGMLVPVVALLGAMSIGTLAKGLGALAIMVGIFVVGIAALGAVAMVVGPGLIMLGAAFALAGLGVLAFGKGVQLMARAGPAALAVMAAAFVAFIALLPQIARQLAAAIVSMIEVFAKAAPRIRKAAVTIIKQALLGVRQVTPDFAKTLIVMINAGIRVLRNSGPKLFELGFFLIDRFLKAANKRAPGIIDSVIKLVVTFLNGIAKRMRSIVDAGTNVIVKFIQGVSKNLRRVIDAGIKLIISFVNGLARGINNNTGRMREAGGRLAFAIINGMTGGLLGAGVSMVRSAAEKVANAIPDKIAHIMGIRSPSKVMHWFGEMISQGLANGMVSRNSLTATTDAASTMIGTVPKAIESAMEIASPSAKARWWGEMIGAGLAIGLRKSIGPAVQAALELVNSVVGAGDSTVLKANQAATLAEAQASREQTRVKYLQARLARTPRSSKTTRASLAKQIKAQKTRAANAEKAADNAAQKVADAIAFRDADAKGRGDILQAQAQANATTAARLMAKAGAESAEATAMARKNRALAALLRRRAKADAAAAKKYADLAKKRQDDALAYYAVEINNRIKAIEDANAAAKKEKDEQAELDAAITPVEKADILNARAKANEDLAATLQADADALIEQAKALAAKDAVAAGKLVDQAEEAAAKAKEAADDAAQQRADAASVIGEGNTNVGDINPSRSVLEDAASVVDRYSESLAAAQEAATAEQPILQFVQNNTSPEALSVSELYRQTNNLMSAAAIKISAKTPGSN